MPGMVRLVSARSVASTRRRRPSGPSQDPVLFHHGQGAMQGQDLNALVTQARKPFPDAFDLPSTGQEDEQVALMAGQGLADGGDEGR